MEAAYSFEPSVDPERITPHYIPDDRTLFSPGICLEAEILERYGGTEDEGYTHLSTFAKTGRNGV
jgi:hypothetical protein